MPPPLLYPIDDIDPAHVELTRDQIYDILPQRDEFMLLDGITYIDVTARRIIAFKEIRPDDWWAKGHLPGRPLFPGVLQIECAAQMAAYITHATFDTDRFLGFTGVDNVKFRGGIVPPCRLTLVGYATSVKKRRTICEAQGLVDGQLVFEATITGMPL